VAGVTVRAALAALLFGTLSGPAYATSGDHGGGATADGAALYARYCALCHGADREGHAADHAPSLRAPELFESASPSYLWHAVAYGRPGTPMAAFAHEQGGPLSHDAQHALLGWLVAEAGVARRELSDAPVRGDPRRGQEVYAQHCAACHGAAGGGVTAPALANPVLLATASDAFLRDTIARGRTGTPMPGFRAVLDDADLDAVTAFLRSRAGGWAAPAPVVVDPPDPSNALQNATALAAELPLREGRFVAADDVAAALAAKRRIVLLDARPLSDWQRGHLPGALPVPFYDGIERILPHLP
jgi:cytochrome c oxidase cbb3-type subunit 3